MTGKDICDAKRLIDQAEKLGLKLEFTTSSVAVIMDGRNVSECSGDADFIRGLLYGFDLAIKRYSHLPEFSRGTPQ